MSFFNQYFRRSRFGAVITNFAILTVFAFVNPSAVFGQERSQSTASLSANVVDDLLDAKQIVSLSLQLNGETYLANLTRVKLLTNDFYAESTQFKNNEYVRRPVETPRITHYRGRLNSPRLNMHEFKVHPYLAISIAEIDGQSEVIGAAVFHREGQVFEIRAGNLRKGVGKDLEISMSRFDDSEDEHECGTDHSLTSHEDGEIDLEGFDFTLGNGNDPSPEAGSGILYLTEIALDADQEYIELTGGLTGAFAEMQARLNQIIPVYEEQTRVTFVISFMHGWLVEDPYPSAKAGDRLNEFRLYWRNNFLYVHRDIAHLWTGLDFQGSTVGIAWIGSVCSNSYTGFGYGISQHYTSNLSALLNLHAHEIGHNFSAPHSDCSPPNIMCSFIQGSEEFSLESAAIISQYASVKSCLDEIDLANALPTINTDPSTQVVFPGQSASFTVLASNAETYQWQRDGLDIPGASSSAYTTPPASFPDDHFSSYRCVVSNSTGSTISNAASLVVVPQPSTITVTVTKNGSALAGVTIDGGELGVAVTNSSGQAQFADVIYGTSYSLTPSLVGHDFIPASISGTVEGETELFFSAEDSTYSIGGIVTFNGSALGGITITGGPGGGSVTTTPNGAFVFPDVVYGSSYELRPISDTYLFTPAVNIGVVTSDVVANFTAEPLPKFSISGTITDDSGNPLANIVVDGGSTLGTQITDANGEYLFDDIPVATSFTITPTSANYQFDPESASGFLVAAVVHDFIGSSNLGHGANKVTADSNDKLQALQH